MSNLAMFNDGNTNISDRLAERKKRIIDANIDALVGKTVVDLASNNGRWSYAAIEAGAEKVISIEGRQERIDDAKKLFSDLNVTDRIQTNHGDMYHWLFENAHLRPDTVFCLGIYYHIMDHYFLLKQIANLQPKTIIIDSGFVRSFRNSVHIQLEDPQLHRNALKVHAEQKAEVVGFVSLGLMIQMAWNLGYSCRPVPWNPSEIDNQASVQDYLIGRRYTVRLEKMNGVVDEDWKTHWNDALVSLDKRFASLLDKEQHDFMVDDRVRSPMKNMEFSIF